MTLPTSAPVARPQTHVIAIWLMVAAAALSIISSIYQLININNIVSQALLTQSGRLSASELSQAAGIIKGFAIAAAVVSLIVGLIVWAVMIWFNLKGKNWARITGTVLGGIGIISMIVALVQPTNDGVTRVFAVLVLILDIAILVFLWLKPTSQFYHAVSARSKGLAAQSAGYQGGTPGYAQPYQQGQLYQQGQFPTYPQQGQPGQPGQPGQFPTYPQQGQPQQPGQFPTYPQPGQPGQPGQFPTYPQQGQQPPQGP